MDNNKDKNLQPSRSVDAQPPSSVEPDKDFPWQTPDGNVQVLQNFPDLFIKRSKTKKKFHLRINIQRYCPREVALRMSKPYEVMIKCKHEERHRDGGWDACKIVRRIPIPRDVDSKRVETWFNKAGLLNIRAPVICQTESAVPIIAKRPSWAERMLKSQSSSSAWRKLGLAAVPRERGAPNAEVVRRRVQGMFV